LDRGSLIFTRRGLKFLSRTPRQPSADEQTLAVAAQGKQSGFLNHSFSF